MFYAFKTHYFLTYPQCNLVKDYVYDHFLQKYNPDELIVSNGFHKDGNQFLQVWVGFRNGLEITDCRYFDIDGFHPHIGDMRKKYLSSTERVKRYMSKRDKNLLLHNII